MTSTDIAVIDTVSKASRYLSGLGATLGFDEALRRVESRSSQEIGEKLRELARWISGEAANAPSPELAMIGQIVRHAPKRAALGPAIGAADAALTDARSLADHVRSGLSGGIGYAAALLAVSGGVALIWRTSIGPKFAVMYEQAGAALPGLSRLLIDLPWIVFAPLITLGGALVAVVLATRHAAIRIETIAPLGNGWLGIALGRSVRRAHARWRTLTLARAWAAGGGDPLASLREAQRVLGADDETATRLAAEMELAASLGTSLGELEFQAHASVASYRDTLELWRAIAIRVLQVAIAVVVGLIVVAAYLPIFKMGAVV